MIETIHKIIQDYDLAVLATSADNMPHCSLMAYAADNECARLYMLTRRDSQKFRNISTNPLVSIMVDTRLDSQERDSIKALTISGVCAEAHDQQGLKKMLVHKHPQLASLAGQQDALVLEIHIKSFLLLDGVEKAIFIEVS